ncbi:hypothetical protein VNO77_17780 [Canavalia gladiata]|uniref:DUF7086 domain-containing protein n=1 Tax=Canavalia gladiata TaxID=3824 RepID=A0AAN9QJ17_CANGL
MENKRKKLEDQEKDSDLLTLSLSSNRTVKPKQQNSKPPLMPSTSSSNPDLNLSPEDADVDVNIGTERTTPRSGAELNVKTDTKRKTSRSGRTRRKPSQGPAPGKSETIPPPYPWATNRRAYIHTRSHLLQNNIRTITGKVQCKNCQKNFEMAFNLEEKLMELCMFIVENEATMHDRAPREWEDPVLPKCEYCGQENSVTPFFGNTKKREINWLFLFLGQMLGYCTLDQLKYFCKHTHIHRTGAKTRVLYYTYMGICQQLLPDGTI